MSSLELRATPRRVASIASLAGLDAVETGVALDAAEVPPPWSTVLRGGMRAAGSAFLVSAVVYGVAWNWSALGYLTRLVMAEGALVVAGVAAVALGPRRWAGQVASIAAAALIGPVLAQVGISYQTGADPWQLFAAWAALSLGFVLAAHHAVGWLGWTVLVQVAVALYLEAAGQDVSAPWGIAGLAALPLAVAAGLWAFEAATGGVAAEAGSGAPASGLDAPKASRHGVAAAATLPLLADSLLITAPVTAIAFASRHEEVGGAVLVALLVATAWAAAELVVGRRAGGGALVGLVAILLAASAIWDDSAVAWLIVAVVVTGVAGATGLAIRHFSGERGEGEGA